MGFGISVRNSSGVEIISEAYRNYQVVASGILTNGGYPAGVQAGQIVLLRPNNWVPGAALVMPNSYVGGYWTSSTGSVEYKIIQQGPSPTTDTFGVRVFDAQGVVTFDAGRAQAIPVATVRQAVAVTTTPATVTVPAISVPGRKRWISYPSPPDLGFRYSKVGGTGWINAVISFNSDTSITLDAEWTDGESGTTYSSNGFQIFCPWHMAAIFEA